MTSETLIEVFRYVGYAGLVLVALGTIGKEIVQENVDKTKDDKIDTLLKGNNDLDAKIDRYQNDLTAKEQKIRELQSAAKNASRGVTSTYDFNGAKRETVAGRTNVVAGEETAIFQKMSGLLEKMKFAELKELCQQQISNTPGWLTPYFFLGIAEYQTGNKSEAIRNLEHVVTEAGNHPDYSQARDLLVRAREL